MNVSRDTILILASDNCAWDYPNQQMKQTTVPESEKKHGEKDRLSKKAALPVTIAAGYFGSVVVAEKNAALPEVVDGAHPDRNGASRESAETPS